MAFAAVNGIGVAGGVEGVVADAAGDLVASLVGEDGVVAGAAVDGVVPRRGGQGVVAIAAGDGHGVPIEEADGDGIVACVAGELDAGHACNGRGVQLASAVDFNVDRVNGGIGTGLDADKDRVVAAGSRDAD